VHSDHAPETKAINQEGIIQYLQRGYKVLQKLYDHIETLMGDIKVYLSQDKSTKSTDFLTFIRDMQKYLDLYNDQRGESIKEYNDFDWVYKPLSHQLILPDSKLIDVKKHWRLFRDWIDKRYFQLQLLYRGSEHGFKKLAFNQRCDN
jgi:hypothetical protein